MKACFTRHTDIGHRNEVGKVIYLTFSIFTINISTVYYKYGFWPEFVA